MAKKKPPQSMFRLEEIDGTVGASLIVAEKMLFAVEYRLPAVRAPYARPTEQELRDRTHQNAQTSGRTPLREIEHYLQSRDKDIAKSLDQIRRAIKRINAAMDCIERAEQVREELTTRNRAKPGSP